MEAVAQHDIDHHIFFTLALKKKRSFLLCLNMPTPSFTGRGYEFLKTFKEKYNNYSNFTKVNNNYSTYVFKQIEFEFRHGIPADDMAFLGGILYQASGEDISRNQELLKKYVNVVYVDAPSQSSIPESVSANIKDALVAYRTKTYKLNRIKRI